MSIDIKELDKMFCIEFTNVTHTLTVNASK